MFILSEFHSKPSFPISQDKNPGLFFASIWGLQLLVISFAFAQKNSIHAIKRRVQSKNVSANIFANRRGGVLNTFLKLFCWLIFPCCFRDRVIAINVCPVPRKIFLLPH
jgi:hypothetical protein